MKTEICIEGFNEIPACEQQEVNGGILHILAAVAAAAVAEVIADWDNFKNGLMGRPEEPGS